MLRHLGAGARLRDAPAARAVLLSLARCAENPQRFSWCGVSTAQRACPPAPAPLPPCGHSPRVPGLLGSPQAPFCSLTSSYNPQSWVFPPKPLPITLQPCTRLRFLSKSRFEIPLSPPKLGDKRKSKNKFPQHRQPGKPCRIPSVIPHQGSLAGEQSGLSVSTSPKHPRAAGSEMPLLFF